MITKKRDWRKLFLALVVCQLAGGIGSIFTTAKIPGWYAGLTRPVFAPPNWIFGPVWTTLYLLMGFALYIVWVSNSPKKKIALTVFGIQLVLNALWSFLFFGLESPFLAFLEIIVLWASILASMILFYPIAKKATWLLLPYILWVSFAAVLNGALWWLN